MRKIIVVTWTFLTLELSQYHKSGSTFFLRRALPVAASSCCNLLRKYPCVCAWPSDQPKLYRSTASKAWPFILHWKLLLPSGIAFGKGLNLDSNLKSGQADSKLNSAAWSTSCKWFISSEIPEYTVWSLNSFKFDWSQFGDAKFEASDELFSTLIPQNEKEFWNIMLLHQTHTTGQNLFLLEWVSTHSTHSTGKPVEWVYTHFILLARICRFNESI